LFPKICHQKKNSGSYLEASSHLGLPLLTVSRRVGRFSFFVKTSASGSLSHFKEPFKVLGIKKDEKISIISKGFKDLERKNSNGF
jgi:hypothetical protein